MAYLKLVPTDAPGVPPAVHLFTDEFRCLFNCPEGTQRATGDNQVRLSKVGAFFFTRVNDPGMLMGFPGACFTVNDVGVDTLDVTAPSGFDRWWETQEHMFRYRNWSLKMQNPAVPWERGKLRVTTIPLKTVETAATSGCFSYLAEVIHKAPFLPQKAKALGIKPGPKFALLKSGVAVANDADPPQVVRPEQVLGEVKQSPGVLLLDVPNIQSLLGSNDGGGLFGSVLDSNTLSSTTPREVLAKIGCVFHLCADPRVINDPAYIALCVTPSTSGLGQECKHVFVAPCTQSAAHAHTNFTSGTVFESAALQRLHMMMLAPASFRSYDQVARSGGNHGLGQWDINGTAFVTRSACAVLREDTVQVFHSVPLNVGASSQGSGAKKAQKSTASGMGSNVVMNCPAASSQFPSMEEARAMLSDMFVATYLKVAPPAITTVDTLWNTLRPPESPMTFTFLGTASAIPSKYRNVTSILVHFLPRGQPVEDQFVVMCDCGEGTLGQIYTLFGSELARRVLLQLRLICVSHMHADHHLGLMSVLRRRAELIKELPVTQRASFSANPLRLIGPVNLDRHSMVSTLCDPATHYYEYFCSHEFVPAGFRRVVATVGANTTSSGAGTSSNPGGEVSTFQPAFPEADDLELSRVKQQIEQSMNLAALVFAPVDHPSDAHCIVIRHNTCGSFCFSGDTRPCSVLAAAAKGVDVLIHEATFDNDKADEAKAKQHSTLDEAINMGTASTATGLILTHFSQRYPKIPEGLDQAHGHPIPVCVAFDLMTVPVTKLAGISAATPAFAALLAEYERIDEAEKEENRAQNAAREAQQSAGKRPRESSSVTEGTRFAAS